MVIADDGIVEALADEIERVSAEGRRLTGPQLADLARTIEPTCNVDAVFDRLIAVLRTRAIAHAEHADELRRLHRWIAETPGAVTLKDVARLGGPHQAAAQALIARLQDA
jgi:hypothetical protein